MKPLWLLPVLTLLAIPTLYAGDTDSPWPSFRNPFSLPLRAPEKESHHPGPVSNDTSLLQESRFTQKDPQPLPQPVSSVMPVSPALVLSVSPALPVSSTY